MFNIFPQNNNEKIVGIRKNIIGVIPAAFFGSNIVDVTKYVSVI